MHKVTMLGSGLIGMFYTLTLHGNRSRDRVEVLFSRSEQRARESAAAWGVPRWTTDMDAAINDPETDVVIVGLPNSMHKEAVLKAAATGKAILCTKPLATNAADAKEMLEAVERAGVFHGYLEDLIYTPKVLKAIASVRAGAVGKVLWTRSRETHAGPHSAWFWDRETSGGGAISDMGCHCIELSRAMVGKEIRPVEVMCWADTQVHPVEVEDHAIGLIRYETGAIGQFEVSWNFRGGMDLRDEVAGTEGTIWINHWLRTGFEMFTRVGQEGYVAEKAEGDRGWLFPVGDELTELGYVPMFSRMLDDLDAGRAPMETFYDGYVVNAIMEAAYASVASKRWEPIKLEIWRGVDGAEQATAFQEYDADHLLIKEEVMPNGTTKRILKEKVGGRIVEKVS
ncbi:MAG TPA: Gfo/Idh/MocA family oxidoreductase [Candidatus Nanopelagicales bacterium]|nr:Gfo/Idh/MocA family oxidoreductase [Candidatus Nanopelagicales bacterium]